MPRIPASASVVLAGLVPACAAALGLGDIQPKSFLNQPLAAEIPVHSDVPAEIAELSVTLAPPETFKKFGLPHPSQLADLSFAVLPGAGGGVIRVTSSAPVAEPFLTLLLELRWPQGRLLREFTVLLDPPGFAAVAPPVARATAVAPPPPADRAVSEPVATPAEPAPAASTALPAGTGSGATHVVQPAETLWTIAERYRPDEAIGINQMMVSIYRNNPGSFAGNINRLRAGALLQIPDRDAIGRLGDVEANQEVARQNREWQAGPAAAAEQPARLELVPPQESAPAAAAGAQAGESTEANLRAELAESRRLLALKDSELQALQQQLAALQGAARDGGAQPAAAPAAKSAPHTAAAPAAKSAAVRKPAASKAKKPAAAAKPGVVDSLLGLFTSVWLWIAAAGVLIGALLLARRRGSAAAVVADDADEGESSVPPQRSSAAAGAAAAPAPGVPSMIVHEGPAPKREPAKLLPTDEESPLEQTIGSGGMLDADRTDPLAEADFHMAYGLYDQAADLLTASVAREPERRDLRLKLLDVLFVWENRDAFLREARALHERLGEADPDWNRIAIMGQQICPGEKLFTSGAGMAPGEMDLQLADTGGTGSIDFNPAAAAAVDALDFDIGEGIDTDVATQIARPGSPGRTQEVPTLELPAAEGAVTTEVPTIQSAALGSTMETPTVEMPAGEGTLESPTVESWAPAGSTTARMPVPAGSTETGSETAEIELEDLGLDLSGLDEVARDMGTGLQEALPDAPATTGIDFEFEETDIRAEGEESTAEMVQDPSLSHFALAMDRDGGTDDGELLIGDTAEQPVSDLTVTGMRSIDPQRLTEDQTMTEVGTKLDLARAYADMGDPDGARSILNEVIEEGDEARRQEARQLLDDLDR